MSSTNTTNTTNTTNIIKSSIYEEGLMRHTINYLTGDVYIFPQVLHRQVNVSYPDADFVNSQSLHKSLTRLVKIELERKYPFIREMRRELEKTTTIQENENVVSRIYRLPLDIVNVSPT